MNYHDEINHGTGEGGRSYITHVDINIFVYEKNSNYGIHMGYSMMYICHIYFSD